MLAMRRSSVWWWMVDPLANAATRTNRLTKRLAHGWSVVVIGSTGHIIHVGAPL